MKIIMIDAFKPEYLKYSPYLSSLTKRFCWGELKMPMGHEGGMEIFFRGDSDKLALFYKKENSSMKFLRYFSFLEKLGNGGRLVIDCLVNFSRLIKGYELFRTGKIPLKQLHKFEFSVNEPAYKMEGVKYYYINKLDIIGHKYGTKSKEMIQAIKEVDKKISLMEFDIILSDHGMADIKRVISVPRTKDCFIDSDMARYWGGRPEFSSKYGKWIEWPDKKYGDHIFLANEGVLILPNYWQGENPVKAMHGYDAKGEDMKAFYIIKKPGKKKNIDIRELHKRFIEMAGKENGK